MGGTTGTHRWYYRYTQVVL